MPVFAQTIVFFARLSGVFAADLDTFLVATVLAGIFLVTTLLATAFLVGALLAITLVSAGSRAALVVSFDKFVVGARRKLTEVKPSTELV